MVHKPKHKVHSFRGLLADGGQDEINLERAELQLAYRIVKFEIMPNIPGAGGGDQDILVQIWKESGNSQGASGGATIDFTNGDMLAAATYSARAPSVPGIFSVVFDNVLFSRNIYVTQTDNDGSDSINYYIELEEVPVGAATLMQLKLQVARKLSLSESAPDA